MRSTIVIVRLRFFFLFCFILFFPSLRSVYLWSMTKHSSDYMKNVKKYFNAVITNTHRTMNRNRVDEREEIAFNTKMPHIIFHVNESGTFQHVCYIMRDAVWVCIFLIKCCCGFSTKHTKFRWFELRSNSCSGWTTNRDSLPISAAHTSAKAFYSMAAYTAVALPSSMAKLWQIFHNESSIFCSTAKA